MPSTTSTVTVYTPCDVVDYRLRVGYGQSVSVMEQAVLQLADALLRDREEAGNPRPVLIDDLCDLLGLGHRLTLDLVHDLWRVGYLRVDRRTGAIMLDPSVREHVEQDRLTELGSAEVADRRAELMVERLSGRVIPVRGAKSPAAPKLAIEPEPEDTTVANIPRGQLMTTLLRSVNQQDTRQAGDRPAGDDLLDRPPERFERRRMSILSCQSVQEAEGGASARRRWLPLDVAVAIDADTERMTVEVVDRGLSPVERQRATDRLITLLRDFPKGTLAGQLAAQAQPGMMAEAAFDDLLSDVTSQVEALPSVAPAERAAAHQDLVAATNQALSALIDIADAQVSIDAVGSGDRDAQLAALCAAARRQLVIVVPRLTPRAWDGLADLVRATLTRSVQVVLLWGDRAGSTLDGSLRTLLFGMLREFAAVPFVIPLSSAKTQTWLAVADDRLALFGGHDNPDASLTALRIAAPGDAKSADDQAGSETVRRLLRWVCRTVPDGQTSRRVLFREEDFIGPIRARPTGAERWAQPDLRPRIPERPTDGDTAADQYAAQSWCEAWGAVRERLAAWQSTLVLPVPRMVDGMQHSDLLWHAVRHARHRLVIAAEHVDKAVVDDLFISALRGRLGAGVEVTLSLPGWSTRPAATRKGDVSPRERLAAVAAEFPRLMRIVPLAGRFLVFDDRVLISDFALLRDGTRGATRARHRQANQLGLLIGDADLAARLSGMVGAVARLPGSAPIADRPALFEPDAIRARQRILNNRATGGDVAGEVKRQLASTSDPWGVVRSLEGAADDHVVDIAVARWLVSHADQAAPAERVRLLRRLLEGRWRAGDYMLAAALRSADPDPGTRPRLPLAGVAASAATHRLDDVLEHVVLSGDTDDVEDRALLVIACRQVVRNGHDRGAVTELGRRLRGPWGELADAVAQCHVYLPGRSVAEVLRQVRATRLQQDARDGAWDALERTLILAQRPPKHLDGSIKMVHALFRTDALLGQLLAACERRDVVAVRDLASAAFGESAAPHVVATNLLDRTWNAVTRSGAKRLHGTPRGAYLGRLEDVVALARQLAADVDSELPLQSPEAQAVVTLVERLESLVTRLDVGDEQRIEAHLIRREIDGLAADLGLPVPPAGGVETPEDGD